MPSLRSLDVILSIPPHHLGCHRRPFIGLSVDQARELGGIARPLGGLEEEAVVGPLAFEAGLAPDLPAAAADGVVP